MALEIDLGSVAAGIGMCVFCHAVSVLLPKLPKRVAKGCAEEDVGRQVGAQATDEQEPSAEPGPEHEELGLSPSQAPGCNRLIRAGGAAALLALVCCAATWTCFQYDALVQEEVSGMVALIGEDFVGSVNRPPVGEGVGDALVGSMDEDAVGGDRSGEGGDVAGPQGERTLASRAHEPLLKIKLTRQRVMATVREGVMDYKTAYFGSLHLGTPAEAFTFVFDTGSGHIVVPSAFCHSSPCENHKRYRRSASSTAVDIDSDGKLVVPNSPREEITVRFGIGEVTGVFVDDYICLLSPTSARNSTQMCARMRFITATDMSPQPFDSFQFDGILGLGLPGLSQAPEFNFMNMISKFKASDHSSAQQMAAIFLGEGESESSELALGGYDKGRLNGDLSWNQVLQPELGYWMIRFNAVRVDGKEVPFCESGCKAVLDTGTSLLSVPTHVFPEIYRLLYHDAALDGFCRGPGPQLEFELPDGFVIKVGPEDYSRMQDVPDRDEYVHFGPTIDDPSYTRSDIFCRPLLMAMDMAPPVGPGLFIFGEPILRRYYTVFDATEMRIGLGVAKHSDHKGKPEQHDDDESWFYAA